MPPDTPDSRQMSNSVESKLSDPGCLIELSATGQVIVFRPLIPSRTEAELLRRWVRVAELARKHGVFRLLIDHSESPPPPLVDMDSVVLKNPEWRENERWRVAILGPSDPDQDTYARLESAAEFVTAIRHEAAVFSHRDEAEAWLQKTGE